jgi:Flp pilus assembly protein TadD
LQAGAGQRVAGNIAGAADYFAKAAKLAPEGLNALAQLAGEAVQAKQFRAAAAALGRLAELQPDNPTIQISLGDVLYQAGDATAARSRWQQALSLAAANDAALRQALDARLHGRIVPQLFE